MILRELQNLKRETKIKHRASPNEVYKFKRFCEDEQKVIVRSSYAKENTSLDLDYFLRSFILSDGTGTPEKPNKVPDKVLNWAIDHKLTIILSGLLALILIVNTFT